jgi:hypothetical protein
MADDADNLASFDLQVQRLNDCNIIVLFGNIRKFNHGVILSLQSVIANPAFFSRVTQYLRSGQVSNLLFCQEIASSLENAPRNDI